MIEYTEQAVMVDDLRHCQNDGDCFKCKFQYNDLCKSEMLGKAADMIGALFKQVEELSQEIARKDQTINELGEEIIMLQEEREEWEERCGL